MKVLLIVSACVLAVFVAGQIYDSWPISLRDPCSDRRAAFYAAIDIVEGGLVAPRTAIFPGPEDDGVILTYYRNCRHEVVAYVDAQNSFGALVRQRFEVDLEYTDRRRWRLIELEYY